MRKNRTIAFAMTGLIGWGLVASLPAQTTRPTAAVTRPATTPAIQVEIKPSPEAKAACDALFEDARRGDVDAVVARMLPRPNTPDPAADTRKKAEALVSLLKAGNTVKTFEAYQAGTLALVPVVGQRPMRPGRPADADPMMLMLKDGKWQVLTTSARAYALDDEQKAAAIALNRKWREVRPTIAVPSTQSATQPAATQP